MGRTTPQVIVSLIRACLNRDVNLPVKYIQNNHTVIIVDMENQSTSDPNNDT